MESLRLHFRDDAHGASPDWPLSAGVHRMVRADDGRVLVGGAVRGLPLAQLCVDRRGLWLQLAEGAQGIHVNGRPVRRMALLRAGDTIHAEGAELLVRAGVERLPSGSKASAVADEADPRVVLRGVGGRHHGRSFVLAGEIEVGSADDADIRIAGVADRLASLRRRGDAVGLRLRDPQATCLVNGVACREALLQAGDQVAFAAQARYVLEVPQAGAVEPAGNLPRPATAAAIAAQAERAASRPGFKRWPWLLLAALLLGLLLATLLLFGGR